MLADPLLTALLGALVGTVMALTGAGGGVLAMPMLVLLLHLPLSVAAPMALLAVGLSASMGALLGLRQGQVRYRAALLMGGMGMVSAPLGVWLSHRLPEKPVLGGMALLLLALTVRAWRLARPSQAQAPANVPCRVEANGPRLTWTAPCARALAATGLQSGLLSGLTGVGGGFIIVPALQRHTDLALGHVQATSLAVMALVSVSGVASALGQGGLRPALALPFAGTAVAALLLGRRLAPHLPEAWMRRLFAAVTAAAAALLMARVLGWL